MTRVPDRTIRRFVIVALVFPALVAVLAVVLQLLALPRLPDPVAVHWGLSGPPNGFASPGFVVVLTALLVLGLPALIAVPALIGLYHGDRGPTYRMMGAITPALSVLLGILFTASLLVQEGLSDAAQAPAITPILFLATAGAVVVGVIAWFLQPRATHRSTTMAIPAQPPLTDSETAVWLQSARLAPVGLVLLSGGVAALLIAAIATLTVAAPDANLVVPFVSLAVVALVLSTTAAFHVRVDARGLTVNSVFGLPRVHVPLSQIERVEAVEVNPLGEFGGWGLRWAPGGGFGVVLRSGPGIRVYRRGGRVFTVTVPDAATGAGLLRAELDRAAREH